MFFFLVGVVAVENVQGESCLVFARNKAQDNCVHRRSNCNAKHMYCTGEFILNDCTTRRVQWLLFLWVVLYVEFSRIISFRLNSAGYRDNCNGCTLDRAQG